MGEQLHVPATLRRPAFFSICSGCQEQYVVGVLHMACLCAYKCEQNRKKKTLLRVTMGAYLREKTPTHILLCSQHSERASVFGFSAKAALLSQRALLLRRSRWRSSVIGWCWPLWPAVSLMEERRPRGHSLSLCLCSLLIRHCLVLNYRLYACAWGSYLYLSLSLSRMHTLSLTLHTCTWKVIQGSVLLGLSYLGHSYPCTGPSFLLTVLLTA